MSPGDSLVTRIILHGVIGLDESVPEQEDFSLVFKLREDIVTRFPLRQSRSGSNQGCRATNFEQVNSQRSLNARQRGKAVHVQFQFCFFQFLG